MNAADSPQFPPRPTALAQNLLRAAIPQGSRVIDATAGNGYDTLFLAGCVGEDGSVLAFDIQQNALISARERLEDAGMAGRVTFIHDSHVRLANHAAPESVAAVMFNLGYLPGEDHRLTTEAGETTAALDAAAGVMIPGGVLSVVCYPGHAAGAVEAEAVGDWMIARTSLKWRVARYGAVGTRRPAPYLFLALKA